MKQKLQSYYPYYEVYTGETNKKNVFIYLINDGIFLGEIMMDK